MRIEVIGLALLFVSAGLGTVIWVWLRRRREAVDTQRLQQAVQDGALPPTLHPVIDADKCIGSLSCLSVCPEGDILGIVDGKAALVNPTVCIGHGQCMLECPVGAISLVFGTSARGIDLPEVSSSFETSRAGVHIVGELGGMGLIKNAITQGVQLSEHLGQQLQRSNSETVSDVVIVGAGPAGLATALGLRKAGLSFRVLEQEEVGGTIAHYPRQKVVMTARVDLPIVGKFGKTYMSKEELLESWDHAIRKGNVQVERGTKVERIDGQDGAFELLTSRGRVRARKVVLAIGRRGTPRKLGVPGEDLNRVAYRLIDAQQYEGTRVLVVGGGDSALEAAIQIADETGAQVSLSYRNAELGKARVANKQRFAALVEEGRIQAFMPSTVKEVTPDTVVLDDNGTPIQLENDYVIACLGGELPAEFLKTNGVSMRRLHGESLDAGAKAARGSAKPDKHERAHRRLAWGLFLLGAAIVAVLGVVGQDYYHLPVAERANHSAHAFLKPAGTWGHGVGIVATLFMMSNFIYALRKRWSRLKGTGSIKTWMTFHQFVGFMSPLVIAFHSAFQSNNLLATLTALSLVTVVLTGVVGRFIFGLVPSGEGKQNELGALKKEYERLKHSLEHEIEATTSDVHVVGDVLHHATTTQVEMPSLGSFLMHRPLQWARDFVDLRRVRRYFKARNDFDEFHEQFEKLRILQAQVTFYRALKQLMGVWRVMHVVLAVCLVVMIAAHIGLSLFLGYKWIF